MSKKKVSDKISDNVAINVTVGKPTKRSKKSTKIIDDTINDIDDTLSDMVRTDVKSPYARFWMFTVYEYNEKMLDGKTRLENLRNAINDHKIVRYIIFQGEIGHKTGNKHLQGYIELNWQVRRKQLQSITGCGKHWCAERRAETNERPIGYCCKPNNLFPASVPKYNTFDADANIREKYGKPDMSQGRRTDLDSKRDDMFNNDKPLSEIIKEDPVLYCKYRNGIRDMAAIRDKELSKDFRQIETILLFGSTGVGKTRYAMNEATYKINGSELNWWDGYENDKVICIDEYNNDIEITKLLNILDGYQLRLPIKGTFTYARWIKVYITTNLTGEQIHANAKPLHIQALWRRITRYCTIKNGKMIDIEKPKVDAKQGYVFDETPIQCAKPTPQPAKKVVEYDTDIIDPESDEDEISYECEECDTTNDVPCRKHCTACGKRPCPIHRPARKVVVRGSKKA